MPSGVASVDHQPAPQLPETHFSAFLARVCVQAAVGFADAMFEQWEWRKIIWSTATWRASPSGSISPRTRWVLMKTVPSRLFFFFFFFFLARTSVGRANDDDHVEQKQTKKKQKTSLCCVCSIAVSLMHAFCAEDDISEPYPGWHAASPGVTAHS